MYFKSLKIIFYALVSIILMLQHEKGMMVVTNSLTLTVARFKAVMKLQTNIKSPIFSTEMRVNIKYIKINQ